jgi:hypothetical protein
MSLNGLNSRFPFSLFCWFPVALIHGKTLSLALLLVQTVLNIYLLADRLYQAAVF